MNAPANNRRALPMELIDRAAQIAASSHVADAFNAALVEALRQRESDAPEWEHTYRGLTVVIASLETATAALRAVQKAMLDEEHLAAHGGLLWRLATAGALRDGAVAARLALDVMAAVGTDLAAQHEAVRSALAGGEVSR